jgi:hypothetical protein
MRPGANGHMKKHTLFFKTSSGINIYKLQLVDELVRRIASYASSRPPTRRASNITSLLAGSHISTSFLDDSQTINPTESNERLQSESVSRQDSMSGKGT